jgi:hypothetical protein
MEGPRSFLRPQKTSGTAPGPGDTISDCDPELYPTGDAETFGSDQHLHTRGLVRLFMVGLFFTVASAPLDAVASERCLLVQIPLERRVEKSITVVEGKVVSQYSFWDAERRNIYTSNLVEVYKVFKGMLTGIHAEIITEGGIVGNEMHVFTPSLSLTPGQMGIFFLEPPKVRNLNSGGEEGGAFMAYGSSQGFIEYNLRENTAQDPFRTFRTIESELYNAITRATGMPYRQVRENVELEEARQQQRKKAARRIMAAPVITSFSPTSITAGTDSVLTIDGSNFGSVQDTGFVEFKNADDGGATFVKPLASDYVSWSDTQIKVKVPSTSGRKAGSGKIRVTNSDPSTTTSADSLTVTFSYTNVTFSATARQPRHVSDNGSGGYTFRMESADFSSNAGANAAFTRAMDTWTCGTGVNWILGPDTTLDAIADDGVNIVRFDNGSELPSGVLGRMTSRYTGCGSDPFDWFVKELDVAFDDGTTWEYGPSLPSGSEYDFETVALHELGHGHQLSHIISPGQLMHYALTIGTSKRTLSSASDSTGGAFVMTKSLVALACSGSDAMSTLACGTVPIQLASFSASVVRDNDVEVAWHTVSEINNYGFELHRKRGDSGLWTTIGFVEGRGTTLTPQYYSYLDRAVPFGKYYYRIKQIDLDGTSEIFPGVEVSVGLGLDKFILAQNYPNPFNPNTVIEFVVPQTGFATLKVYNVLGQEVAKLFEGNAEAATIHTARLDASKLASGMYFYRLTAGGRVETRRMLVLK